MNRIRKFIFFVRILYTLILLYIWAICFVTDIVTGSDSMYIMLPFLGIAYAASVIAYDWAIKYTIKYYQALIEREKTRPL